MTSLLLAPNVTVTNDADQPWFISDETAEKPRKVLGEHLGLREYVSSAFSGKDSRGDAQYEAEPATTALLKERAPGY